jgi:mRNA interferase HigB
MRILNEPRVTRFMRKHPDARQWLDAWLAIVREADWQSIADLKQAYPTADGGVKVYSGARVTVFDVGGNKYRLIANVSYALRTVAVLEVMTHAEYSKERWKRRY